MFLKFHYFVHFLHIVDYVLVMEVFRKTPTWVFFDIFEQNF